VHPLRQSGSCHFQMTTTGQLICLLEQGTLACAACSPVRFDTDVRRRPKGPAQTSSLSSTYKSNGQWKIYPPLSLFLPPRQGEHHRRSLPASSHATWPFDDSFGGVAPHALLLLLPQVSWSLGESSGLHCASPGWPLLMPVSPWYCASHHRWGVASCPRYPCAAQGPS
jgi:hypothetical protein